MTQVMSRTQSIRASLTCLLLGSLLLSACSGDGNETDNGNPDPQELQGIFLDSAVSGLDYVTSSGTSGLTDSDGSFRYHDGESITFSIGDLSLPSVAGQPIVTPLTVFQTDDVNDVRVVNLARLLQSLDQDADPDNGISLSSLANQAATDTIDFAAADFDASVLNFLANSGASEPALVSSVAAVEHLSQTLADNDLLETECTTSHPAVGRTAEFETHFHEVAGTLTVVDDCTLRIDNFTYDGQGPLVYFYTGNDNNFTGSSAFIIGPLLTGTVFDNQQVLLTLPDGKTLDDFNSLSVWCVDFAISFGDVYFGP